jgi:hypothetical protein
MASANNPKRESPNTAHPTHAGLSWPSMQRLARSFQCVDGRLLGELSDDGSIPPPSRVIGMRIRNGNDRRRDYCGVSGGITEDFVSCIAFDSRTSNSS